MKILLVAALVALIHGSYATLHINRTVDNYGMSTLDCWYSDSELNISQVHFEFFRKRWHRLLRSEEIRRWCFHQFYPVAHQEGEHLYIYLRDEYLTRPFRCASHAENVTVEDQYSPTIKLPYLGYVSLSRDGINDYLRFPNELKVRQGEDVVVNCSASSSEKPSYSWTKDGSDWILPSSLLTLREVTARDGGKYTCIVKHPTENNLIRKETFSLTVLSEDAPWYETSNGHLVLMTSVAAVSLLLFILSMSIFLCRRAKKAKTSKGPIDDRSQQKPIYKTSVESLPSTCADKQPLV